MVLYKEQRQWCERKLGMPSSNKHNNNYKITKDVIVILIKKIFDVTEV